MALVEYFALNKYVSMVDRTVDQAYPAADQLVFDRNIGKVSLLSAEHQIFADLLR